jgi:hypothetical protein
MLDTSLLGAVGGMIGIGKEFVAGFATDGKLGFPAISELLECDKLTDMLFDWFVLEGFDCLPSPVNGGKEIAGAAFNRGFTDATCMLCTIPPDRAILGGRPDLD